ncbi:unnamed protein product [Arabis nemorensis]|uniref:CCHC-type domain-containing protein n=1 Tax=Arabis nemorensis TaxID=586526 RepID=A0A565CBF5_9BRAS|nr:unnamed protein product [Arabis nemorensis]
MMGIESKRVETKSTDESVVIVTIRQDMTRGEDQDIKMPHVYREKSKGGQTVTEDVRVRFRGCFHCGKRGHKWQRCFKRKRREIGSF